MKTRAEHIAWCKQRALAFVDAGDTQQAFTSMASDLNSHPETTGHSAVNLGMGLMVAGHLKTESEMREFIEGFN